MALSGCGSVVLAGVNDNLGFGHCEDLMCGKC
jgi:hypothetical protein